MAEQKFTYLTIPLNQEINRRQNFVRGRLVMLKDTMNTHAEAWAEVAQMSNSIQVIFNIKKLFDIVFKAVGEVYVLGMRELPQSTLVTHEEHAYQNLLLSKYKDLKKTDKELVELMQSVDLLEKQRKELEAKRAAGSVGT